MTKEPVNFSIIDNGLSIEGVIHSKGQLIVKGDIKGTVNGDTVVIAEHGAIVADVTVNNITIGGSLKGTVQVRDTLTILSTGTCSGRVSCKNLLVEAGGKLNADVSCLKPAAPPGPSPQLDVPVKKP